MDGHVARLSFLIWYGLSKSAMNFVTGKICDDYGRKNVLVAGWLVGLPGVACVVRLYIYAHIFTWL